MCTPFSLKVAYELNEIGVDCFKIGSGEMTDIPTIKAIAALGKPMIVSTGMCTLDEAQRTYDVCSACQSYEKRKSVIGTNVLKN